MASSIKSWGGVGCWVLLLSSVWLLQASQWSCSQRRERESSSNQPGSSTSQIGKIWMKTFLFVWSGAVNLLPLTVIIDKSAQVVTSHLVCDPTIRQPGFDLRWQQWSLLNHFCTEQVHVVPAEGNGDLQTLICALWRDPDDVSLIVESCPLTKLNGGLSRLHSADEDAVSWLTNYGK